MKTDYCVAIRTLGTAGDKYQKLLNSLVSQTIPAKEIFVYIPYGYDIPKETIGIEKIIRCDKGMVTQRSFSFDEINTEFILFTDDDIYYPNDFVENIFNCVNQNEVDCISIDLYEPHKMSLFGRFLSTIYNSTTPRSDDGWALKIKKNVGYTYNVDPQKNFLPTQTGSGGCIFCRKKTFLSIHFQDERWLEHFRFASYDDQLFIYKMFLMGVKTYLYYNSGVLHLDAKASKRPDISKKMLYKKMILYIVWYRTIFDIHSKSNREKIRCQLSFFLRNIIDVIPMIGDVLRYRQPKFLYDYFAGLLAGYRFVHSDDYLCIPKFDAYIK